MKAWTYRSSGRASRRSSSVPCSGADRSGMGRHEVRRLTHGQDPRRLLVGDADAVVVLELDHQLHQVQRVGLQVLLEARALPDRGRLDLELLGQVGAYALEYLLAIHGLATLAAGADRNAPAAASDSAVLS